MLQIGRKIYFCVFTGEKLAEIDEKSGGVRETTIEEDFASYTGLRGRTIESVGVIQLAYGEYASKFASCNGYRVNAETKEIIFSFAPVEASIDEVKAATLQKISDDCHNDIINGYWSEADGERRFYGYNEEDQGNLSKYMIAIIDGQQGPFLWKEKGGIPRPYTVAQIKQLYYDGGRNTQEKWMRFHMEFKVPIENGSLTREQIEAMHW